MGTRLLWIGAAGALGTLARYAVSGLGARWQTGGFPSGTLVVNALGCLLFGLLWALGEHRLVIATETRLIVTAGFLGAFTTFSTFAFETARLLQDSRLGLAVLNVVAQNGVGLAAVWLGIALGQRLFTAA